MPVQNKERKAWGGKLKGQMVRNCAPQIVKGVYLQAAAVPNQIFLKSGGQKKKVEGELGKR